MGTQKMKKTGFRITFEDGETLTRYLQPIATKKPFKIEFIARNKDIMRGVFGFDRIPKEKIVVSDYEKLKKEYKPLSEKIRGEQYIPSWLSLRKDQTVELELDWTKKGKADDYETISFEPHADFTFEPKNLKDAEKVKIICLSASFPNIFVVFS